jgi:glycosyltransferase involved in cell wall biosynthesis
VTANETLDVSVIFSTRNRARTLEQTLSHIARQDVGSLRWELIVVDNGSTDATSAVLHSASAVLPLVSLVEPVQGKNRAMNRAVAVAKGSLLLFSDDDIVPDRRWIAEMHAAAERWPAHVMFGGQILLTYPPGTPEWRREVGDFDAGLPRYAYPQPEGPIAQLPFGPSYAVRAEAVRNLRFDEQVGPGAGPRYAMGSETEFLRRLADVTGTGAIYVPSSLVHHVVDRHQLTTGYLLGRTFRLGRGMTRMRVDNLGMGLQPQRRSRSLFGAPRYLWQRAAQAALGVVSHLPADPRSRLNAGLKFTFLAGCIYEYRSQSKVDAR